MQYHTNDVIGQIYDVTDPWPDTHIWLYIYHRNINGKRTLQIESTTSRNGYNNKLCDFRAHVSNSDSENSDWKTATAKQRLTHNSDRVISDCQNSDSHTWATNENGDRFHSDHEKQRLLQSEKESLSIFWACICDKVSVMFVCFESFDLFDFLTFKVSNRLVS